jgi:hypothetical protein
MDARLVLRRNLERGQTVLPRRLTLSKKWRRKRQQKNHPRRSEAVLLPRTNKMTIPWLAARLVLPDPLGVTPRQYLLLGGNSRLG